VFALAVGKDTLVPWESKSHRKRASAQRITSPNGMRKRQWEDGCIIKLLASWALSLSDFLGITRYF
jgi:hypothetical protein